MKDGVLGPLRLRPVYKEKMWGGRNLARLLGKDLPAGVPIGESWEVGDESIVADGPLAGKSLAALSSELGPALLGKLAFERYGPVFPLLIKFIDAQDKLSVQVHPDDEYARREEGVTFGKTEMWYVVNASPGAEVIHGIKSEHLAPENLAALARGGGLVEHLHRVPVRAGDVIHIPAGTVHAMGEGLLIYEVQQNCDVTYRFYDWDRLTAEGQPRELHVERAVAVSRPGPHEHQTPPLVLEREYGRRRPLAACRYFAVELLELVAPMRAETDGRSLLALCVLSGRGEIRGPRGSTAVHGGEPVVFPAQAAEYELRPEGEWRVILASVPDLLRDVVRPLRASGVPKEAILRLGGSDLGVNDLAGLLRE